MGGVRALHTVLDVVDHDVVAEATWSAVAPADTFVDVDTAGRRRNGLGIELPGLA